MYVREIWHKKFSYKIGNLPLFLLCYRDFFWFLSLITLLPWPWLNIWKVRGTVILEIPQFICKPEAGGNSVIPYCLEFLVMKWAAFIKKTNKQINKTKQNKPDPSRVKFIILKVKTLKANLPWWNKYNFSSTYLTGLLTRRGKHNKFPLRIKHFLSQLCLDKTDNIFVSWNTYSLIKIKEIHDKNNPLILPNKWQKNSIINTYSSLSKHSQILNSQMGI